MFSKTAFIESVPVKRRVIAQRPCLICHEHKHSTRHTTKSPHPTLRRTRINACVTPPTDSNSANTEFSAQGFNGYVTDEVDFDEDVVSDDTHVVIDSKDINLLIQQLQISGGDDLTSLYDDDDDDDSERKDVNVLKNAAISSSETKTKQPDITNHLNETPDPPGFDAEFFNAAERLSDSRDGRPSTVGMPLPHHNLYPPAPSDDNILHPNTSVSTHSTQSFFQSSSTPPSQTTSANQFQSQTNTEPRDAVQDVNETEAMPNADFIDFEPMDYFKNENREYMPSWVREMYDHNEHQKLEIGSNDLSNGKRKLHDIVERESNEQLDPFDDSSNGDGILDCTIGDVADDYHLPMEFLVDALVAFGVQTPIKRKQSIRNTLTTAEIQRLLLILARHDSTVLAERYSDRTIAELADDYDLDPGIIIKACQREGLYIHAGEETHLSVVREDRVLDIILKDEPFGKPYPPLLEGLEEEEQEQDDSS